MHRNIRETIIDAEIQEQYSCYCISFLVCEGFLSLLIIFISLIYGFIIFMLSLHPPTLMPTIQPSFITILPFNSSTIKTQPLGMPSLKLSNAT